MMRLLTVAFALAALALSPLGAPATAQDRPLSDEEAQRARRISDQIMSPFCPGRTLNECPSPSAGEWREDVRRWVGEGVPPDEIRRRFETRMPEADLTGNPGGEAPTNPILWIVLVALILPAAVLFPRAVAKRRERRAAAHAEPPEPSGSDAKLDDRLERELEALDR